MSRHEIVEKLESELSRPIERESQVVYIMVETRKYLESTGQLDNYPALRLYCDWVVHSKLDRLGAEEVIRAIDGFVEKWDPLESTCRHASLSIL